VSPRAQLVKLSCSFFQQSSSNGRNQRLGDYLETYVCMCVCMCGLLQWSLHKQAVWEAATICPRPLQVDLWHTFDLESGVRVTCDVGYLCANFNLPRHLCSRLRPDVPVRGTRCIDSLWKCLIQIILKLSSAVSRSSVSVYRVSLWIAAPKFFRQN